MNLYPEKNGFDNRFIHRQTYRSEPGQNVTKKVRPTGGRPPKDTRGDQKAALSLRVTPELRDQLIQAAESNFRSISQEAELRLERSFGDRDFLPSVLETAYGSDFAALILVLAKVMSDAGNLVAASSSIDHDVGWTRLPSAYSLASKLAQEIITAAAPEATAPAEHAHPDGKPFTPEERAVMHLFEVRQPRRNVRRILRAIVSNGGDRDLQRWAKPIKAMMNEKTKEALGLLADRLAPSAKGGSETDGSDS